VGMRGSELLGLSRVPEVLRGVLANRLEHPVTLARMANQTLVDERLQRVEIGLRDRLGGFESAAAEEDGEPAEEALLVLGEQVVAPLDRRPEGALPLRSVSSAAREEWQALLGRER
jgi:hypothetical protein